MLVIVLLLANVVYRSVDPCSAFFVLPLVLFYHTFIVTLFHNMGFCSVPSF